VSAGGFFDRAAARRDVRVKICGVTRLEDALLAARLGADALGFNFWPRSKRYVPPAAAGEIVRQLPPGVTPFGVFVNPARDEALAAVDASGVAVAQLHGDEDPLLCASLPVPVVKGLRIATSRDLAQLAAYEVAAFLLDAPSAGYGGSGQPCDWGLASEVARELPVLLAGGLSAENVADAVRTVHPLGVDVASGVESAPGVKDAALLERFIRSAKEAAA
jgi:phosphoribosylanthranilate isomerase